MSPLSSVEAFLEGLPEGDEQFMMVTNEKFLVKAPYYCREEFDYAVNVVLGEFLGLSWERIVSDNDAITITTSSGVQTLNLNNDFFKRIYKSPLTADSLPELPLQEMEIKLGNTGCNLVEHTVPVLYGKPGLWRQDQNINIEVDIFGSVFFMLSRYEEAVVKEKDAHGRFPVKESVAYKSGFFSRPLVDEYVEILWACLKALWPRVERKRRSYRLLLTHDVDHPFVAYGKSWAKILRNIGGDVVRRKDLALPFNRIRCRMKNDPDIDPANTFDFLMDVSESYGLRSEFYFLVEHKMPLDGSSYSLKSMPITKLLVNIHNRGHRIGFHGSYSSFNMPEQIKMEFEKLVSAVSTLGINQESWGGRQHYLRFTNPITWQGWEDAGLDYDSTLGFADTIGFRCGTCHEFHVFNIETKKKLHLRERPLVCMDVSLGNIDDPRTYSPDLIERVVNVADLCKLFDGTFVLLWHNDHLITTAQRRLYRDIVESVM